MTRNALPNKVKDLKDVMSSLQTNKNYSAIIWGRETSTHKYNTATTKKVKKENGKLQYHLKEQKKWKLKANVDGRNAKS